MATYNSMVVVPFSASGDLSSNQYKFVMQSSTAGRVELATGASGPVPMGVLQNDPISTEGANVCIFGVTQIWVSSSIALGYGDFITCGSLGGAETADGTTAASFIQGKALEAIAAGSGYVTMLYAPQYAILSDNTP